MDILLGIIGVAIGLGVCFAGLQLFHFMLPIWGFVSGFFTGAALVTALFGDGFLSSALGLIVGLVVAVIFAIFAYLYWYVGALMAAGSIGVLVGSGLMATFGVSSTWILWVVGVIVGAAFVFAAMAFNLPEMMIVVSSSLAGSVVVIGGLLLILNRIDRTDLGQAAVWQKLDENWILWILWLIVAAVGMGAQFRTMKETQLPTNRWDKAIA